VTEPESSSPTSQTPVLVPLVGASDAAGKRYQLGFEVGLLYGS
jgi:hypothetical protein